MEESLFIKQIEKHKGIIIKIVHLYTDSQNDKADLQQEILYQAWKSASRFRGDSKFSTWLYRIALNTAITFLKSSEKHKNASSLEGLQIESSNKDEFDHKNQLYWAIKQLSTIDKTIITLHLDGFDNGEIADLIGTSRNTLNVKLHRVKGRIIEQLKKEAHGLA